MRPHDAKVESVVRCPISVRIESANPYRRPASSHQPCCGCLGDSLPINMVQIIDATEAPSESFDAGSL